MSNISTSLLEAKLKKLQEDIALMGRVLILDLSLSFQQVVRIKKELDFKHKEIERIREQLQQLKGDVK